MNPLLITAIKEQLGITSALKGTMTDIERHGAMATITPIGAITGFTSRQDTCKFFDDNKALIIEHTISQAHWLREGVITMVRNFDAIEGDFSELEIASVLVGDEEIIAIKRAMARYVLDEACTYCVRRNDFTEDEAQA